MNNSTSKTRTRQVKPVERFDPGAYSDQEDTSGESLGSCDSVEYCEEEDDVYVADGFVVPDDDDNELDDDDRELLGPGMVSLLQRARQRARQLKKPKKNVHDQQK